jgi:hypothetical protein
MVCSSCKGHTLGALAAFLCINACFGFFPLKDSPHVLENFQFIFSDFDSIEPYFLPLDHEIGG